MAKWMRELVSCSLVMVGMEEVVAGVAGGWVEAMGWEMAAVEAGMEADGAGGGRLMVDAAGSKVADTKLV